MAKPTERNAECHIEASMSMIQAHRRLYDFERQKAVLRETLPPLERATGLSTALTAWATGSLAMLSPKNGLSWE